jgi:hypothetical protein
MLIHKKKTLKSKKSFMCSVYFRVAAKTHETHQQKFGSQFESLKEQQQKKVDTEAHSREGKWIASKKRAKQSMEQKTLTKFRSVFMNG